MRVRCKALFERHLILKHNFLFACQERESAAEPTPKLPWRNQASFSSLNRRAVAPLETSLALVCGFSKQRSARTTKLTRRETTLPKNARLIAVGFSALLGRRNITPDLKCLLVTPALSHPSLFCKGLRRRRKLKHPTFIYAFVAFGIIYPYFCALAV